MDALWLVATVEPQHLGAVDTMIIRKLKITADRADVEVSGDGNTYRFTMTPVRGAQILSGQFVAGEMREGKNGVVTRWVAPSLVMAQNVPSAREEQPANLPPYMRLELERNRRWFRELMTRVLFAK